MNLFSNHSETKMIKKETKMFNNTKVSHFPLYDSHFFMWACMRKKFQAFIHFFLILNIFEWAIRERSYVSGFFVWESAFISERFHGFVNMRTQKCVCQVIFVSSSNDIIWNRKMCECVYTVLHEHTQKTFLEGMRA